MDIEEDYSTLTVPQLKEKLKELGLPLSGAKAVLVERLKESRGTKRQEPPSATNGEPAKKKAKTETKSKKPSKTDESEEDEEESTKKTKGKAKAKTSKTDEDGEGEVVVKETDFASPILASGELKIVTWNVAGWKAILGKGFNDYLKKENPDILCLNETKYAQDLIKEDHFPGYHTYFYSCKDNAGYSGVAFLSKVKPISITKGISVAEHDKEGRVITAEFGKFYVVATYIPNSGTKKDAKTKLPDGLDYRMEWDKAFFDYLKKLDKVKPVIWCGDLNVAHLEIDIKNPKTNRKTAGFTDKERESFGNFLKDGFVDSYRKLYPKETDCFTFWPYKFNCRARDIGWRLDYFVVSERFVSNVTQAYIRKFIMGSDHCPIAIHLKNEEA